MRLAKAGWLAARGGAGEGEQDARIGHVLRGRVVGSRRLSALRRPAGRELPRALSARNSSKRPKRILCPIAPQGVKVEGQVVDGHERGRRHLARRGAGGAGRRGSRSGRCSRRSSGSGGRGSSRKRALRIESRPRRVKSWPLRALRVGSTQSNMSTPARHRLDEVLRRAHAHQVARLVRGQDRDRGASSTRVACRPWARPRRGRRSRSRGSRAPRARARSARAGRGGRRPARCRRATGRRGVCASRLRRAQRVVRAVASVHRLARRGIGRALVEGHDDVRAQVLLDLDRALGREHVRASRRGGSGSARLPRSSVRSPARLKTW